MVPPSQRKKSIYRFFCTLVVPLACGSQLQNVFEGKVPSFVLGLPERQTTKANLEPMTHKLSIQQ